MGGVYTERGELDPEKTCFMVSNDSVFSAAAQYDELLPGCSVNPQGRDASDELSRCRDKGAVLVKVIPNTQGFDPSGRRYAPFFRRMAELGMPLLTHPGYEFARSYPNIHLDLSATTVPTRAGILFRIRKTPELKGRLLLGSDYHVPPVLPSLRLLDEAP